MEGMEQDSPMKKPGNPDVHAAFFQVSFFSHPFFRIFRALVETMLAIEHTRGMALCEVPIYLLFDFRMYLAGVPQSEPHGKGDLSTFFSLVLVIYFAFFSYFFSDFQSFWHEQRIFSFQVYHKLVVMFVSFESAGSNRDLSQRQVSTLVLCHVRHWIFNEALGLRHVRISCGLASLESHMSLVHYKCTSLVSLGMKNAKKWKFTILLLGPWVSVPDKH